MSQGNFDTTKHYDRIKLFMIKAKQGTPIRPKIPDEAVRLLRAKLILEEALETIKALGVTVEADQRDLQHHRYDFEWSISGEPNLPEIADGCADISVVTIGTLIACGIPDAKLLEVVDRNNLDKFGVGHMLRGDGKLVKPPGHEPPDVAGFLKQLMPSEADVQI